MRINVTQDDIDNGVSSCVWCPVARAVARATEMYVEVTATDIWIGHTPLVGRFVDTPEAAADFILQFDTNRKVQPFEFELPD